MESDAVYFRRRASEENLAAIRADHPRARKAHLELAGRYDDLADAIDEQERSALPRRRRGKRTGMWL
ncbi:hypothetical protein LZ016_11285 [Sphingomonas sp. SM33]|uniref:Uncharacterized protein n=1 Tax=Sphingomonas telluris TaxID=2907998 RepID=A0ABS9VNX3_9SPHN|nr:hypothetical protein [Sphingomonas telluris]MCH8616679.1 hypothetical protein [Sphingomonas telluris]